VRRLGPNGPGPWSHARRRGPLLRLARGAAMQRGGPWRAASAGAASWRLQRDFANIPKRQAPGASVPRRTPPQRRRRPGPRRRPGRQWQLPRTRPSMECGGRKPGPTLPRRAAAVTVPARSVAATPGPVPPGGPPPQVARESDCRGFQCAALCAPCQCAAGHSGHCH
jgi:hypothetical protein